MIRLSVLMGCICLGLTACQEELAAVPNPVTLNAEAVGFYCQMNVLEHPGPKAQIHLDGMPAPIFFSQVSDAIAYLHMPEQSHAVVVAYVHDMAKAQSWAKPGADNWIPIETGQFVLGSDQLGGMGAPEVVPFSDRVKAEAFAAKHGGRVVTLDQISDADVLSVKTPAAKDSDNDGDIGARLKNLAKPEVAPPVLSIPLGG